MFTDCDYVSSFVGKGIASAFKLLKENEACQVAMAHLGSSFALDSSIVDLLKNLFCKLYGSDGKCVNKLGFKMFVTNINFMPPCRDVLNQLCNRANYIAVIWKSATLSNINAPNPWDHGWVLAENQCDILWYKG